jgi:hypothetical protein
VFGDLTDDIRDGIGVDVMRGNTEFTDVSNGVFSRTVTKGAPLATGEEKVDWEGETFASHSLCRSTENMLTGNGQPSSDGTIKLGKIVHHTDIRRITDVSFGHGKVSAGSSDSDGCRHGDTGSSAH